MIVASVELFLPRLSTQLIFSESPFLPPLKLNFRYGSFGDRRSPQRGQHRLAAMLERDHLDVVRRDQVAGAVLDEPAIHRVLDQRLNFHAVVAGNGPDANACHLYFLSPEILPSAAATAKRDLGLFGGAVQFAAGLDDGEHLAGLRHLDTAGNAGRSAFGNLVATPPA